MTADRRGAATCRSTPTCTRTSRPDSDVPIDRLRPPGRRARHRRAGDHRPRRLRRARRPTATRPSSDRERIVRDAADRWAPLGLAIRFGIELTYERAWEDDIRDHLRRHAYDFVIGSVHIGADSPYAAGRVASWVAGRSLAEIVAPYYEEVEAAARSGPVRRASATSTSSSATSHPHVTAERPRRRARAARADPAGARRDGHRAGDQHQRPSPGRRPRPIRRRPPSPGSASSAVSGSPSAPTRIVPSTSRGPWPTATARPARRASSRCRSDAEPIESPSRSADARLGDVTPDDTTFELFVAGAGPSYTDRPGALGAAYLLRVRRRAPAAGPGPGRLPGVAAEVPTRSACWRRSSSATSIPTTSSTWSRSATTSAGSQAAGVGSGSIGPAGLGDRLDALHAEPGFSGEGARYRGASPRSAHRRPVRGRGGPGPPHRGQLRLPRLDRTAVGPRVLGRLRARGGPRPAHPAGRRAADARSASGPGRSRRAPSTSTGRWSAPWRSGRASPACC